jgi:uncharacterized protein YlxW (UPF0749 family)
MGLKKYADKLDDYFGRLAHGKAEKIKPSHVEKVIRKLQAKQEQLQAEIEATTKESKKARLERKFQFAKEHIKRAELLLKNIDPSAKTEAAADTPTGGK